MADLSYRGKFWVAGTAAMATFWICAVGAGWWLSGAPDGEQDDAPSFFRRIGHEASVAFESQRRSRSTPDEHSPWQHPALR